MLLLIHIGGGYGEAKVWTKFAIEPEKSSAILKKAKKWIEMLEPIRVSRSLSQCPESVVDPYSFSFTGSLPRGRRVSPGE